MFDQGSEAKFYIIIHNTNLEISGGYLIFQGKYFTKIGNSLFVIGETINFNLKLK